MGELILQYLMWALPSGGVGAAVAWMVNRRRRHTEEAKVVHDTYKAMYEDVSALLMATQERNRQTNDQLEEMERESRRTRSALNRLSRAIEAIQLCPHRLECPVRDELRDEQANAGGEECQRAKRQDRGRHAQGDRGSVEGRREGRHGEPDHKS